MSKLLSLAEKPATKEDVGKTVYWLAPETKDKNIVKSFVILKIDSEIISGEWIDASINSKQIYWNKPILISEQEYNELVSLVKEAVEIMEEQMQEDCWRFGVECSGCKFIKLCKLHSFINKAKGIINPPEGEKESEE